jgi:hypothetical protein
VAEFSACKVVASLPGTLVANTVYLVRVGTGFRPYVTNSSGTIVSYPLDPITWSEISGKPDVATQSEVDAGVETGKIVTPATMRANCLRRLRIRYGAVPGSNFSTDCYAEQESDPTSQGLTWINQGSSLFHPTSGILEAVGTSSRIAGLRYAMPAGAWDICLWMTLVSANGVPSGGTGGNYTPFGGLFITDGTKLVVLGESTSSASNAAYPYRYGHYSYWTNQTTFASQGGVFAIAPGDIRAYRMLYNGAGTLTFLYSRDGVFFDGLANVSLTAHIASPTHVGFCAGMTGNVGAWMQVQAFRRFA